MLRAVSPPRSAAVRIPHATLRIQPRRCGKPSDWMVCYKVIFLPTYNDLGSLKRERILSFGVLLSR